MNSPIIHTEKLRMFIKHEINMIQHIKELTGTSMAAKTMIDPTKIDTRTVMEDLYRQVRIQSGFSATKHIIPWLSPKGFKANELMYYSAYGKEEESPLNSIDFHQNILEMDEDFYAKAMAFMLILSKKNHLYSNQVGSPTDEQFSKIIELIRYNGFTIDHHHQAQLMPQFRLSEEQTGIAFLILQVVGHKVILSDLENILSGCEFLSRYSAPNTLKLCGLEIQIQKSGKTKYTLSNEMKEKFRSKVEPFVKNYNSLWCAPIYQTFKVG